MTDLDRTALAMYCAAFDEYMLADILVKSCRAAGGSEGSELVQRTEKDTYYINPSVNVRSGAWKRVMLAATEFGITPSSRTGISAVPADKPKQGKARFFGNSGGA